MVRLRARAGGASSHRGCCFNSNMVRLRVVEKLRSDANIPFQFQYGAIESIKPGMIVPYAHKFQFQYGAIERLPFGIELLKFGGFNSNMVRLRDSNQDETVSPFKFQFQYGAIESRTAHHEETHQKRFNSNMVRLRG